MKHMTRLDYVQLAKELTGSDDLDFLLGSARKLETFANETLEPSSIPLLFADFAEQYVKLQHPLRGSTPLEFFPFQKEFATRLQDSTWLIHCTGRQLGASSVLAAYGLWFAALHGRHRIDIRSYRVASAYETGDRLRFALANLPMSIHPGVVTTNKQSIKFRNGSTITFGTVNSDDAHEEMAKADLIILTDVAWVSHAYADWVKASLYDARDRSARVVVSSCPNTASGLFYDLWKEAKPDERLRHSWDQHPARDEVWERKFRDLLGDDKFNTEMGAEFPPDQPT